MTKDTKYSILALLSGFAVAALGIGLALAGVDFAGAGRDWFQLVLWTGFIFGLFAYHRRAWLARAKPLLVFVTLIAVHTVILVLYLRSGYSFPNLFFLIFCPVDAALVALVVGLVGGRIGLPRRRGGRQPRAKSPPDMT